MSEAVLITGASGLLGRELVRVFIDAGFFVYAQYHTRPPEDLIKKNCQWIAADFSTYEGIRDFVIENSLLFKQCRYLINNYGPITNKKLDQLTADDFYTDFHQNVIPAFELMNFFIRHTHVEAIVNIGFEGVGEVKPYKKILTYAAAKNMLQLITESFDAHHDDVRIHLYSPPTMVGAEVKAPGGEKKSPETVAREIFELII